MSEWWRGDWARLSAALAASAYFFYYASSAYDWHFLDNVNLLIHEAGHWIFSPFGEFLGILGGSLFQSLFPLIYIGYFAWYREYYSASLLVFWFAQNLINVSVYAGDAVSRELPLLGGDSVVHDWSYLLGTMNQLSHAQDMGFFLFNTGMLMVIAAAVLSLYFSQSNPRA